MATKAQLEKENKALLAERKKLQKKYDRLRIAKDKSDLNVIALVTSKNKTIAALQKADVEATSHLHDHTSHFFEFASKPWWRRIWYSKEQLRHTFIHGEL